MKIVLYTALYGGYHSKFLPLPDIGIDAYAFTDNPDAAAPGWQTVVVSFPDKDMHPRMQAKWFKMHPHELFPEYDVSIWIDAGWRVVNTRIAEEMPAYLGDANICFFPHRRNKTLLDELYETMGINKYVGLPCPTQVAYYYSAEYKDESGVLECTSLLRRHNEENIKQFNKAWWKQCRKWTYADQISAPYLLWDFNVKFNKYPFNLDQQTWFRIAEWRGDI